MTHYPRHFLPALLLTLASVTASGLLLAPTTLALRADWDLSWRLAGGDRTGVAALHAAAAFAATAFVGALWTTHMRSGWRRRRQRITGALLAGSAAGLVLSATGVYYLGDERAAAIAAFVHLALGLLVIGVFAVHALGRRRRRRSPARGHAGTGPAAPQRPPTPRG